MRYINANCVLPQELIKEIQKHVNGVNLYIPKVLEVRNNCTSYRLETYKRNMEIYDKFLKGEKVSALATEFYLSEKSIYRILGEIKKE